MGILGPISNVSSQEASCCTDDSFELFLIGDADSGGLTPFESEMDETESKLVNQVLQPVEVGSWEVPWGIDGDYPADTWDFNIHYEVQGAVGVNINMTVEVRIGGSFYEGGTSGLEPYLTGEGDVQSSIDIESGDIREDDILEITLIVQLLGFNQPGDNSGVVFQWGSSGKASGISVKMPLVDIEMKDASVSGNLVYFPILISSGFEDRIWSSSSGIFEVQNVAVADKPVATLVEGGVEVTFVWSIPEGVESGSFLTEFTLEPQSGLLIESNMTHFIESGGDDGGGASWYPASEPLRSGGSDIVIGVDANWDGKEVTKKVSLEFDGAMSQWMRWGLDNIGNQSLGSSSWWRSLNSYSSSVPDSDYNNKMVDSSEISALEGYLTGSNSDLESFLSNGLFIEAEAIIGIDPFELGPTQVSVDLGGTSGFSSETITIRISTSYSLMEGERQLLIESFSRSSDEDYWTGVSVDIKIQGSMLTDIGIVTASGIDYSHRRWIVSETLSVYETDLDPEQTFRVEFTPSGNGLFSVLLGSGMMVLILSLSIGTGMTMTRKRSRFPTMITVATLGILSFSIYFLGLPMQMVLGVVTSSVLLVFPISLLSPKTGGGSGISNAPRVKCPSCGAIVMVESEVRPLRITCQGCDSVIRIEE
tara:strand:+ start:17486 stop:19429 length:1944 start_codon:yes stop_codon:yes gene_type:complete